MIAEKVNIKVESARRFLKGNWSIALSHDPGYVTVASHHEAFTPHRSVTGRIKIGNLAIFLLRDNVQHLIDSTRDIDVSFKDTFVDVRGRMTVDGNLTIGSGTLMTLGSGGGWSTGFWARKRMQRFQPHIARARNMKTYHDWMVERGYGKPNTLTTTSLNTPVALAGKSAKSITFGP